MGKFSGLFKKSDDKQKPGSPSLSDSSSSNPYAGASANPYAQPSPPAQQQQQFQQHNAAQYRDNQSVSQSSYSQSAYSQPSHSPSSYGAPSYGSSSGLPSGPRPGGLPSRVNQGPGAWGYDRDSQGAPPSYSERADDTSPVASTNTSPSVVPSVFSRRANSNQNSPSLTSGAPSPAFSAKTASPSIGTGYPSEKYGANDGIGRTRFESPASRQDQFPPSQRPGGYGNLDSAREDLFRGYNHNQQTSPNLAQSDSPYSQQGNFPDRQHMTEEELEEAQLADTKAQIKTAYVDLEDTMDRALARAEAVDYGLDAAHEDLARQEEIVDGIHMRLNHTHKLNEDAKESTARLKHANRSLFRPGFSNTKEDQLAAERAERNVGYMQEVDALRAAQQARKQGGSRAVEDKDTRVLGLKPVSQATLNRYAYEDDDGEQEMALARMAAKEERLEVVTGRIKNKAVFLGERIDSSNARLGDLGESATRARDDIERNRIRMHRAAGDKNY